MEEYKKIANCVLEGDDETIESAIEDGLSKGCSASELINNGLIAGMDEVGVLFKDGDLFVPEVLMSAQAMNIGMNMLRPLLKEGENSRKGKIVMLTVKGDLHDIGKNLCSIMLESAGFEIIDLGVDVSPQTVCDAVEKNAADIVGMSAMLTTTMQAMDEVIKVLRENEATRNVKIMVGGAPLNNEFADSIGAEYSSDATGAIQLAMDIMNNQKAPN